MSHGWGILSHIYCISISGGLCFLWKQWLQVPLQTAKLGMLQFIPHQAGWDISHPATVLSSVQPPSLPGESVACIRAGDLSWSCKEINIFFFPPWNVTRKNHTNHHCVPAPPAFCFPGFLKSQIWEKFIQVVFYCMRHLINPLLWKIEEYVKGN